MSKDMTVEEEFIIYKKNEGYKLTKDEEIIFLKHKIDELEERLSSLKRQRCFIRGCESRCVDG